MLLVFQETVNVFHNGHGGNLKNGNKGLDSTSYDISFAPIHLTFAQ